MESRYEWVCPVHGVVEGVVGSAIGITKPYLICRTCFRMVTIRQSNEVFDEKIDTLEHVIKTLGSRIDYTAQKVIRSNKKIDELENSTEAKLDLLADGFTVFNDKLEELNKKHAIAITSLMNRVDEIDGEIDNLCDAIFDD